MNNGVNHTIISRPSYITFKCPFCHEKVEVNFEEVDFNTNYWGDGAPLAVIKQYIENQKNI